MGLRAERSAGRTASPSILSSPARNAIGTNLRPIISVHRRTPCVSMPTSAHPSCRTLNADREPRLYKVTGTDPTGRAVTFACGTDLQALDKVRELMGRGFRDILVADPKGQQTSGAAFERSVGLEYD